MTFYQRIWIYWPVMSTQYILVDLIPIDWMLTFYQYFLVGLLPTNWKLTYCQVDFLQTHLWNLPSSIKIYSFFYIVGLKSIRYQKSKYLLMWKNISTLIFAPKLNNLWLLLCHGFWGPLELYSFSKMTKNLDSWP